MFPFMLFPLTMLALLMSWPSLAQDAPTTIVYTEGFFGWLRPYVVELVGLVIAAAVTWATKKFHDLTGMQIEGKHREALQSALRNGANLALDKLPGGGQVDVRSAAMAAAIRYVLGSVPDAVAYFELSPEKIAELLQPKFATPPTVTIGVAETT